jgi:YD repeat-containing protein
VGKRPVSKPNGWSIGGASMTYAYDPLNRLASVLDASGTTTYGYDAVGNLAGYAYPNGVSTTYVYDPLNRLTSMQSRCGTAGSTAALGCGAPGTPIASYAYTLGAAGNRLSVAELSGRSDHVYSNSGYGTSVGGRCCCSTPSIPPSYGGSRSDTFGYARKRTRTDTRAATSTAATA